MSEVGLLSQIRDDLRTSPVETVIYLEGRTDPKFLFALLGLPNPPDGLHQGVLVKGLKDEGSRRGSGSNAVMARVELASRNDLPRVFGVMDGDGRTIEELTSSFDPPYLGPLFRWKAYCIENLLAKTGWPLAWGEGPDWSAELSNYGPYVALNRVGSEARAILRELGLEKYSNPAHGIPLRLSDEITAALAAGKARLLSFDVEQEYRDQLSTFGATVLRSLDEAHALINGKWLFRHMAPTLTSRDPGQCEFDWLAHARSTGGLPEVREWWERVTGSPP